MTTAALEHIDRAIRDSLAAHMAFCGESADDILSACVKGYDTFTVWTTRRVYFPATYDGNVWVTSAPRDPCDEANSPVGG